MKKECPITPRLKGLPQMFMLVALHHTDGAVGLVHKVSPGRSWVDDTLHNFRLCTPQSVHSQEHHQLAQLSSCFVAAPLQKSERGPREVQLKAKANTHLRPEELSVNAPQEHVIKCLLITA